jgi:hypothetical protein
MLHVTLLVTYTHVMSTLEMPSLHNTSRPFRQTENSPLIFQACHRIRLDWTWWVWPWRRGRHSGWRWIISWIGPARTTRRIDPWTWACIISILTRERIDSWGMSTKIRKWRWRAWRCTVCGGACNGWRVPALCWRRRLSLLLLLPTPAWQFHMLKNQLIAHSPIAWSIQKNQESRFIQHIDNASFPNTTLLREVQITRFFSKMIKPSSTKASQTNTWMWKFDVYP